MEIDAIRSGGPPHRTLTRKLTEEVGREIVSGGYADRPFPREADLMLQHRVSRSAVREAVKMLTSKGLLSARPRLGTVVEPVGKWNLLDTEVLDWILGRNVSPQLLKQFNTLRLAVEPKAAEIAALEASAVDRDAVRDGFGRMEAAAVGRDDPLEADIAFHVALLRATGNIFFMQFEGLIATALRTSIQFTNTAEGHTADLPEHRAILEGVLARRPDLAAAAARRLIERVLAVLDRVGTGATSPR